MAKYYKLIDPFDIPAVLYLPHIVNGRKKYEILSLKPGKKYSEHIDDESFLAALRKATKDISYTAKRKASLDAYGATYTVRKCGSCGGGVRKLRVNVVEVVE